MQRAKWLGLAFLVLVVFGWIYLYPGSQALLEGRVDTVMSDGTDATTLPYQYDRVIQIWKNKPSHLMYGAVYDEGIDGDRGAALWIPWSERIAIVFFSYFVPTEQISTAFIFSILVFNGLAFLLLATYMGWGRLLALGLGVAWAFSCYTRARAKVHGALAGTFHLPLIFLGLLLVARGRSWKSLSAAGLVFLIAATTAHYYLVTSVFISPLFVIFLCLQPEFKARKREILIRLLVAVLPTIMFLGFNRWVTVPPGAKMTIAQSMNAEWLESAEISPFLRVFKASPIDYLGGDISLGDSGDINPLRNFVNEHIASNLGQSNAHERTNGVRWAVLALALLSVISLFRGKFKKSLELGTVWFFFGFGLFAFWMSLGPEAPIPHLSPAYWLYSFDNHIRVASRAGILTHFSLLMLVGMYISNARWVKKAKWIGPALAGLIIVDYVPIQKMPMAVIAPAYTLLQRDSGACGQGMAFPYINQWNTSLEYYVLLQRMRKSDCAILNSIGDRKKVSLLLNKFPPSGEYLAQVERSPSAAIEVQRFARCVPLNWIVFHPYTPKRWALEVCSSLGWSFSEDMSCISPVKNRPQEKEFDLCL